jgi:hypothetical protein
MTQDTFLEKPEREMASLRSRIAGEYREMPGLSLTLAQAARLWALIVRRPSASLRAFQKRTSCPAHAMASTDCPENHDAQSEREFGMARSGRMWRLRFGDKRPGADAALPRSAGDCGDTSNRACDARQWLRGVDTTPNGQFALTAYRYAPDVVHPDGMHHISAFEISPWPRWIFDLPDGTRIVQEIFIHHRGGGHISWRRDSLEDLASPGMVSWDLEGGEAFWILSASTAERRRNVRRLVTSDAGKRHRIIVSSDASILGPRENTACGSRGERT